MTRGPEDDADPLDGTSGFMDLEGTAQVWCPYCGESVELILDPGGGPAQEYVEDCEVCCRPWHVRVRFERDGRPSVSLTTLDEA